jgi:hypothetical protein
MNQDYAKTRFSFSLQEINRVNNTFWSRGGDINKYGSENLDAKYALHKGTYTTLNLYFMTHFLEATGFFGYCSFPQTPVRNRWSTLPGDILLADGCSIDVDTMPGGANHEANAGRTASHEVGHWLGLFHVFWDTEENGVAECKDNDFVEDTPIQSTPTRGCPSKKDSCPADPGLDSIHNIMDYSNDCCMDKENPLTPGQIDRANRIWDVRKETATLFMNN